MAFTVGLAALDLERVSARLPGPKRASPEAIAETRSLLFAEVVERARVRAGPGPLFVNLLSRRTPAVLRVVNEFPACLVLPGAGQLLHGFRKAVKSQLERHRIRNAASPPPKAKLGAFQDWLFVACDASGPPRSDSARFAGVCNDGRAIFGTAIGGVSTVSESHALIAAIRRFSEDGRRAVFFSDSRAAVDQVRACFGQGAIEPLPEIFAIAEAELGGVRRFGSRFRRGHDFEICWCSGHAGFPLNEAADQVARAARHFDIAGEFHALSGDGAAVEDTALRAVQHSLSQGLARWDLAEALSMAAADGVRFRW